MSRTHHEAQQQLFKKAFDEVIEEYQNAKHSSLNGMKSIDYSTMHDSKSSRADIVVASKSDFICDVEKTARLVLEGDTRLFRVFLQNYVHLTEVPSTQDPDIDKIRFELGKAFHFRRIWPVSSYMQPKHIDRSKAAK